jgi:putative FmdB family regulatory protein
MPIYDFACLDCGEHFEALVLGKNKAACPACQSEKLEQQISMFAVDSEGTRQLNLNAARRKNEKVRREKAVAEHEALHNHHD